MNNKECIEWLQDIAASICNHANDSNYDLERTRDNKRREAINYAITRLWKEHKGD